MEVSDALGDYSADQELAEVTVDVSEAINSAKQDVNFLAGLAMPTIFEYRFPPVYLTIWDWLVNLANKSRGNTDVMAELFARLAVGLPRGFAKTTLIKLFIFYVILFTSRKFILILSATSTHARNIISDITDMLDEPNIKALFGDWRIGIEKDTQDLVKFGFRGRTVILAGLGAGGSVRGFNLKNERPDIMVFEDVQTREDADSQVVSESLYKWMIGTAMKAKSPRRCMTIFIANMYPTPHSILKKLINNPHWTKFVAGGILEDGTSLWEELQPIEQLLIEYQTDLEAGHPEIFFSEVLNDPDAAVNNLVDLSKLPEYPFEDNDIPDGKFIVIDPSNDKHNSDNVAIGYFEVHDTNKPCLIELTEQKLSPGETIREAIRMGMEHNCRLVVVESNAYQYSLLYWSKFICNQMGILGFNFVDIYSGKLTKNTRILTMFKQYAKAEIYVHPSCKSRVHMQIAGFRPLKSDNIDNTLDLLTYAPRVVEEFGEYLATTTIEGEQLIANSDEIADEYQLAAF